MHIILIGATGTLGAAIVEELSPRHTLATVGRKSGDLHYDVTSASALREMYKQAGPFDALIFAAGTVVFEELAAMTQEKYEVGLRDKLMVQVNLVLSGLPLIRDKGSFTLTSGVLSRDPIRTGSSASMVNGAIEAFVRAAAIEMPRGIRINAISPTVLSESMGDYAPRFRGFSPIPAARAALAFSKSVEGLQTGQVYCVE